jgi:HAD superfamily hydrolase (TIGR01509 family)
MDGVLVDGEPLHFAAVNEVLAEEGLSMSFEEYRPHMGTKYGWEEMVAELGLKHPREHYSQRFRAMMTERYRECSLPLPGAGPLVRSLEAAGVPIAVCSSSIVPWVDACLSKIGILDAFDAIVTGTDVTHGKPAPDIYLLAAEHSASSPSPASPSRMRRRASVRTQVGDDRMGRPHRVHLATWSSRTPTASSNRSRI